MTTLPIVSPITHTATDAVLEVVKQEGTASHVTEEGPASHTVNEPIIQSITSATVVQYNISTDLADFLKINSNKTHTKGYIFNKLRTNLIPNLVGINKYKLDYKLKRLFKL